MLKNFEKNCLGSSNFLEFMQKTQNFCLHLAKYEKIEKKKHIFAPSPKNTCGRGAKFLSKSFFIMVDLLKQERLKSVSMADSLFLTGCTLSQVIVKFYLIWIFFMFQTFFPGVGRTVFYHFSLVPFCNYWVSRLIAYVSIFEKNLEMPHLAWHLGFVS